MKVRTYEVYETFWKCRDLEIEHYWHRIVFMTAFMLGCFTAYGGWMAIALDKDSKVSFVLGNGIAFYVALIGIVMSLLWVMMAKGSKAWYEEYEHLINAFATGKNKDTFFRKEIQNYIGLEYWNFPCLEKADINDFLWSTKAGSYSVSKIGIAIGHLAFTIWVTLAIIHLIVVKTCNNWEQVESHIVERWCSMPCLVVVGTVFLLLFWIYAKSQLFSGYFLRRKVCP